jgi:hypothetical protein
MDEFQMEKIAVIPLLKHTNGIMCLHGARCYVLVEKSVHVYDILTGMLIEKRALNFDSDIMSMHISNDGDKLFILEDYGIVCYDISDTPAYKEDRLLTRPWVGNTRMVEGKNEFIFMFFEKSNWVVMINYVKRNGDIYFYVDNKDYPISLSYDIEKDILYAATHLGHIHCWSAESGRLIFRRSLGTVLYNVCWKDKRHIVTVTWRGVMALWEIAHYGIAYIGEIGKIGQGAKIVESTPDGRYIITKHDREYIRLWSKHLPNRFRDYHYQGSTNIKTIKVSSDGCFLVTLDAKHRLTIFKLGNALAPVFHSARVCSHLEKCETIQVNASDGCLSMATKTGPSPILFITPETTITKESTVEFSVVGEDMAEKRTFKTETEAEANECVDAMSAIRWHLQKPYKDRCMLPKAAIIKAHRFDLLQLINRQNGGRGIVPGKTVPKDAMEIIRNYMK